MWTMDLGGVNPVAIYVDPWVVGLYWLVLAKLINSVKLYLQASEIRYYIADNPCIRIF